MTMSDSPDISFDFYGLRVAVRCDREELADDIRRDYSYFLADIDEADVNLDVFSDAGPREDLPALPATLQTPRNIVYRNGEVSYVDHFGRGLSIVHEREQTYHIYSDNRDLAHEIAFLTILSRVGRHLDARRLFRVHALGVEAGGRGVLLLLPMGGGKTTLAMRLLQEGNVKLLSEDSPLLGPGGTVLPFPLRIGVRVGGEPEGIPAHFCRTVERMEFCPKTLIDIEYFRDRLAGPCPIGAVLLGERRLAGPASIQPLSRRSAVTPFIKNTVVGLGLYQGVEFVLERSGWEVLSKMGLAMRRLGASLSAIRRADVYRFAMGPDVENSADVLGEFLQHFPACPA